MTPTPIEWRPVRVEGTYLADEQVVIINRAQGGVVGKNVVTPLQTADGETGAGEPWVRRRDRRCPPTAAGAVSITGRIRATERRGFGGLTDPADGELTELHRLDIERLAEQLPAPVAPVLGRTADVRPVVADRPRSPAGPGARRRTAPVVHGAVVHLLGCAIVGWVLAMRRSARRQVSAAAAQGPSDLPTEPADEPTTATH